MSDMTAEDKTEAEMTPPPSPARRVTFFATDVSSTEASGETSNSTTCSSTSTSRRATHPEEAGIPSRRRRSSLLSLAQRAHQRRRSGVRRHTILMKGRSQSVKEFSTTKSRQFLIRWNLLWAVLVLVLGLMPNWIFIFGCQSGWAVVATVLLVVNATFWVAALLTWRTMWEEWKEYKAHLPGRGKKDSKMEDEDDGPPAPPPTETDGSSASSPTSTSSSGRANTNGHVVDSPLSLMENGGVPESTSNGHGHGFGHSGHFTEGEPTNEDLVHLCVMAAYKEPMSLICASVDSVANQTCADRTIMVVGFEEGTPNYEAKCAEMHKRYGSSKFKRFLTTVHPKFLPGEIAGTCSNVNWAVRQSTALLRDEREPLDPKLTLLTKCDTDTIFAPRYFEVLERVYLELEEEDRLGAMYQSVLCYNLKLDERCVLARVTGILRTFFMCGFLIPFNINTMSIYSLSLHLSRQSQYWHPGYQMEDIMMNLNLMNGIGRRVPIVLLPIPTLSGPTSGPTVWSECSEWRLQARRWTIGAAEVFHYYVCKMLGGSFDIRSGLNYGLVFTWYYGIMLCVTGIFGLCAMWAVPAYGCTSPDELGGMGWLNAYPYISPASGFAFFFGFKYLFVFGTAFVADWFHRSILDVEEPTLGIAGGWRGSLRSIGHWLSSQPVLWGYSIVELLAILELAVRGRAVCAHIPSRKESLADANNAYVEVRPGTRMSGVGFEFRASTIASHRPGGEMKGSVRPPPLLNPSDLGSGVLSVSSVGSLCDEVVDVDGTTDAQRRTSLARGSFSHPAEGSAGASPRANSLKSVPEDFRCDGSDEFEPDGIAA